jgi:hypothetical protein
MTKMTKKLFEIDHYYLSPVLITVCLADEREVLIDKEKFERWLERSGRLEYSFIMPDHTGEPKECEGVMSANSYWGEWDAYNDLYEYIIVHNEVDPFDIKDSLSSILNDFSPSND